MTMPTALSHQGAQFIEHFEGFRADLYDDAAGNCTIGIGHLVHMGRCNGSEPGEFRQGISRQRAEEILQQDAASAASAVHDHVKVPLSQERFDALVSFVFNVGAGNFESSTLLRELNAKHYHAVPEQLLQWTHAGGQVLPGLVTRRKAEGELFATEKYPHLA